MVASRSPLIVTYATHAGGTFELLLADTQHYHLPMTVLGWGEPWTGFFGKLCALHAYASALKNASAADDILIVIDAFDTRVTGTMQTMEEIHAKYFGENDIVFSVCNKIPFLSRRMSDRVLVKIFGGVLSAGMHMGRVRSLLTLYSEAFLHRQACRGDDQCAFNPVIMTGNNDTTAAPPPQDYHGHRAPNVLERRVQRPAS